MITPDTKLEELEQFFTTQEQLPCGVRFALVTDQGKSIYFPRIGLSRSGADSRGSRRLAARKFTLGVVTADDLQK